MALVRLVALMTVVGYEDAELALEAALEVATEVLGAALEVAL